MSFLQAQADRNNYRKEHLAAFDAFIARDNAIRATKKEDWIQEIELKELYKEFAWLTKKWDELTMVMEKEYHAEKGEVIRKDDLHMRILDLDHAANVHTRGEGFDQTPGRGAEYWDQREQPHKRK